MDDQIDFDRKLNDLRNDFQKQINIIMDRTLKLERLAGTKMFPRKMCGYCSGTGKVYLGTICDPPVGDCKICDAKGFI